MPTLYNPIAANNDKITTSTYFDFDFESTRNQQPKLQS